MLIDRLPSGQVKIPGSKSISHRALICAALSGGGKLENVADSKDIQATLRCLEAFGARYSAQDGTISFEKGISTPERGVRIPCGESGSTIRFLIPLAAALDSEVNFTGEGRLMERPMDIYTKTLGAMGVKAENVGDAFKVSGKLIAGRYELPGDVSSQFVTGLLFALPLLEGDSEIVLLSKLQSRDYVDLTLNCLEQWGVKVANNNYRSFTVPGGQSFAPCNYRVEADYSAASFFLAAGALGCDVHCVGLSKSSRQADRRFLDILDDCGAKVEWLAQGGVKVSADKLRGMSVDVSEIPDLVPPLAVVMCFCQGGGEITNAARLRIKESDRLMAVATELTRLGARIEQGGDFLKISCAESFGSGKCHAHNDHRIAMMVALASIKSKGEVFIDDPGCVAKSYPDFWEDFLKVKRKG